MAKEGIIRFAETELITGEELIARWPGATLSEIAIHCKNGELRGMGHFKGPINGWIWANPKGVQYKNWQGQIALPDYFVLADVITLEKINLEYTGDIEPPDNKKVKVDENIQINNGKQQTLNAISARQEKTLKTWKSVLRPAFMTVFVEIIQQTPQDITEKQLIDKLEKEKIALNNNQLQFFKSCFPTGFIKNTPGAKKIS